MKKTKAVSLLLSLSLLATLAIPGTLAQSVQADTTQENKGMVINKTSEANDDGTYTITLEAYATGSKVITETKKDIPTDIVLVLDQSGSMKDAIGRSHSRHTQKEIVTMIQPTRTITVCVITEAVPIFTTLSETVRMLLFRLQLSKI